LANHHSIILPKKGEDLAPERKGGSKRGEGDALSIRSGRREKTRCVTPIKKGGRSRGGAGSVISPGGGRPSLFLSFKGLFEGGSEHRPSEKPQESRDRQHRDAKRGRKLLPSLEKKKTLESRFIPITREKKEWEKVIFCVDTEEERGRRSSYQKERTQKGFRAPTNSLGKSRCEGSPP